MKYLNHFRFLSVPPLFIKSLSSHQIEDGREKNANTSDTIKRCYALPISLFFFSFFLHEKQGFGTPVRREAGRMDYMSQTHPRAGLCSPERPVDVEGAPSLLRRSLRDVGGVVRAARLDDLGARGAGAALGVVLSPRAVLLALAHVDHHAGGGGGARVQLVLLAWS